MSLPPASSPKTNPRVRRPWARLSGKPEVRSIQVGVIATIVFHLLLLWLAPKFNLGDFGGGPSQVVFDPANDPARNFEIEIPQDLFPMPEKPKPPQNFVETNPDAPDNVPDQTNNFSSQNQQVAQEKPTPDGKSEAPAMEGDKEKKSNAIVTGQLADPAPPSPPPVAPKENPEEQPQTAQEESRRAQTPLSGFEKLTGEDKAGIGSNIAKIAPHPTDAPESVDGAPDAKSDQGVTAVSRIKIDPRRPAPRPSLPSSALRARPAPLMDNQFGTDNMGITAYNAKWSNYGEYLKKLIDSVQIQWERILYQTSIYPPAGTKVTVTFRINSKGEVYEFTQVESSGGQQASTSCTSAIKARSPYGPWTDDMIALLGDTQDLTFTFYYQ